jgi:hypothetical protein
MFQVSIINKISEKMTVPFTDPFIILECSCNSEDFINKCKSIAAKYYYNVHYINFNYKVHKDYLKFSQTKKSTQAQVEEYKKIILPNLYVSETNGIATSKTSIFNIVTEFNLIFDEDDLKYFSECILNKDRKYFIIGDVHSCLDELKELLLTNKFNIVDDIIEPTAYDLIFVGDLIDKGNDNKSMIDFIHKNINNPRIKFVLGNHESTIYDLLTDESKVNFTSEVISKYFNTYAEIKDLAETRAKFIEIYKVMRPFYFYYGKKNSHAFYVNHSPCNNSLLYKINDTCMKKQVYRYCVGITEAALNSMLLDKNGFDIVYHVIGHVQMAESYFTSNGTIFIDTGCISGNKLSGVILGNNKLYPKFRSVKFMNKQPIISMKGIQLTNQALLSKQKTTTNKSYNTDVNTTVKSLLNNKINFVSGTISPANKFTNQKGDKIILESLESALTYYCNKFKEGKCHNELIVMPKYMGSRINVYLFRDFDKTYGITRNGYVARVSQSIYKALHDRLVDYMMQNKIKMMIVDGELMPWKLLAKDLIEEKYKPISVGIEHTSSMLQRTGFDLAYEKLLANADTLNSSDKKYLSQQKNSHIGSKELRKLGVSYTEQMNIYSADGDPHVKGFSILKIVFDDDTEFLPGIINIQSNDKTGMTNAECFRLVNDDEILVLDLSKDLDDLLKFSIQFFNTLQSAKFEGVVIRPNLVDPEIMTPYLKVRNEEYLRLTYGYDYLMSNKYQQLVKKKNIKKKLELSKEQFKIGVKMLKVPYGDIIMNKEAIKKHLRAFLISDLKHGEIDPRL